MAGGHNNPSRMSECGIPNHPPLDQIDFAHPSERIAAEILDFYCVKWLYEPRTFAIEFSDEGQPTAYFTPDFFLPEFDLYIELTTMNQKLVTKKNRKVRRLKELYPEVNIKIFYQKDFRALLARFGIASESQDHASGGGFISSETGAREKGL